MSRIILFCACVLCFQPLFGEQVDGYAYLNQVRQQAGMTPFTYNKQLAIAAQNHANYLHIHRRGGHGQRPGDRGYTGSTHPERVVRAGYLSRLTAENVSYHTGNKDVKESIDGLMTAIYHRFGFLTFKYDEVGIGSTQTSEFSTHVYNFGNSLKNEICLQRSYNQRGSYVYSVCADERFRVAPYQMEQAEHAVRTQNVDVVVWPPHQGVDVMPGFYEEDPDPLPDYDVSGNPVSIQFNPAAFPAGLPVVTRFQIFRDSDDQPLATALQLNASTDTNRKIKASEHALFPEHRLDWGTRYRVEVGYRDATGEESLDWEFTTRSLDIPMVIITGANQAVQARPGEPFAIYLPPRGPRDGEGVYRSRFPRGMNLDIQIYDNHTLIVNVTGRPGNATINFHGLDIRLMM